MFASQILKHVCLKQLKKSPPMHSINPSPWNPQHNHNNNTNNNSRS